ncbi:MAG: threonine/serine dehydratase [Maricaulaceae bacterium]
MSDPHTLPKPDDVAAAAVRLQGLARLTPLLRDEALDALTGAEVWIKPECLQRTGSFKIRGAGNRLLQLTSEEKQRGVVAYSSGNHAQGVAEAARVLGIKATIVMPADAPAAKRAGVVERGADLVAYDRATESRETIAAEIGDRTGAILVPSYDDPAIIAGQGTAGLEIFQTLGPDRAPDAVLCCTGGGGLIAGIGLAADHLGVRTELYACEPDGFDDHKRSLAAGRRVANAAQTGSVCDALLAPEPGALTFALNRDRLAGALVVSDAQALDAVAVAFRRLKLVVEPGGAVALAALLSNQIELKGQRVVVVLTGGNVDPGVFAKAIGGA